MSNLKKLNVAIDGTLSCNRAIDVDVIDCYEKRKQVRAFVKKLFSSKGNFTPLPLSPEFDINEGQQIGLFSSENKGYDPMARAYAIEKEIQQFSSENKRRHLPQPKA